MDFGAVTEVGNISSHFCRRSVEENIKLTLTYFFVFFYYFPS